MPAALKTARARFADKPAGAASALEKLLAIETQLANGIVYVGEREVHRILLEPLPTSGSHSLTRIFSVDTSRLR